MGFSILSMVEFFYYLFIRWTCVKNDDAVEPTIESVEIINEEIYERNMLETSTVIDIFDEITVESDLSVKDLED
jgi:hypothetical protein